MARASWVGGRKGLKWEWRRGKGDSQRVEEQVAGDLDEVLIHTPEDQDLRLRSGWSAALKVYVERQARFVTVCEFLGFCRFRKFRFRLGAQSGASDAELGRCHCKIVRSVLGMGEVAARWEGLVKVRIQER